MTIVDDIKQRQEKRYYIIKDYVVGKLYITTDKAANILFGELLTDNESKQITNLDYLTTLGIKQQIVFCGKNNDSALLVGDKSLDQTNKQTQSLVLELKKAFREITQGIDYSIRRKTKEEIESGKTIRVVGIYNSLGNAKEGYALIRQKEKEKGILEFEENERVFIKYPHSQIPKNFCGKVLPSTKTTRELT